MAIKLNTSNNSLEKLNERKAKKIAERFKYATYALGGVLGIIIIAQTVKIVGLCMDLSENNKIFNAHVDTFHAVQAQQAEKEAANTDEDGNPIEASEVTKITVELSSAYEAGCEVAALETEFCNVGGDIEQISNEKASALKAYIGDPNAWIRTKSKFSPPDVKWEFNTQYGIDSKIIPDCSWTCYTADGKYMLMVVTGEYNVETNSFKIDTNRMYRTDFGRMYVDNGAIEGDRYSDAGQEINDLKNYLDGLEDEDADSELNDDEESADNDEAIGDTSDETTDDENVESDENGESDDEKKPLDDTSEDSTKKTNEEE